MRPKTELAIGLAIVAFVWISLFGRWLPMPIQSALFYAVLLLAFAMIVAGWWRIRGIHKEMITSWRKWIGLTGLTADTLALAVPFLVFLDAFYRFNHRLQPRNNWFVAIPVCLGFCLLGFIAGLLAPPRIRLTTAMAGLIVGALIVSVPIGIL